VTQKGARSHSGHWLLAKMNRARSAPPDDSTTKQTRLLAQCGGAERGVCAVVWGGGFLRQPFIVLCYTGHGDPVLSVGSSTSLKGGMNELSV